MFYRWQGLYDSVIAGNIAVVIQWYVEVTSHQNFFPSHVDISNGFFSHFLFLYVIHWTLTSYIFAIFSIISTVRFE
ncbi:hypothetical protein ES707_15875 [subsurface metagenome]